MYWFDSSIKNQLIVYGATLAIVLPIIVFVAIKIKKIRNKTEYNRSKRKRRSRKYKKIGRIFNRKRINRVLS